MPPVTAQKAPRHKDHLQLHPRLGDKLTEFERWWDNKQAASEQSNQPVAPLFHYTNAAGLKGIIESGEVWLSNVLHLNDTSEYRFGLNLAMDELNKFGSDKNDEVRRFCSIFRSAVLEDVHERLFSFFVASFSRKGNDLGQWRAYGDNGRGFAVGLSPSLFHPSHCEPEPPSERFFCCANCLR